MHAAAPTSAALAEDAAALLRLHAALRRAGHGFVTPTPATVARVNARADSAEARDLRGALGWSRPFAEGAVPPDVFAALRDGGALAPAGDGLWRSALRASTLDGLLFLHSAYPTTGEDAVFFGPDTHRFADAILRALAERETPVRRAADVGAGSGAGGVLVARAHPRAEVWLGDINRAALRLARANAAANGCPNALAVESDVLAGVEGEFDLIVSNPPYLLDPARRAYRHGGGALGEGLSVRILRESLARLAPGGTLVLYTGVAVVGGRDAFLEAARDALAQAAGFAWTYREADPDVFGEELEGEDGPYARADRIAAVVVTATKTD